MYINLTVFNLTISSNLKYNIKNKMYYTSMNYYMLKSLFITKVRTISISSNMGSVISGNLKKNYKEN